MCGCVGALNASSIYIVLCVFEEKKRAKNVQLLFLHGFSSKNREILHKVVLSPQEYGDYFLLKKLRKSVIFFTKPVADVLQVKIGLKRITKIKLF